VLNRRRVIIEALKRKFEIIETKKALGFRLKSSFKTADSKEVASNKAIVMSKTLQGNVAPGEELESHRIIQLAAKVKSGVGISKKIESTTLLATTNLLRLISYRIGQLKAVRTILTSLEAKASSKSTFGLNVEKEDGFEKAVQFKAVKTNKIQVRDANVHEVSLPLVAAATKSVNIVDTQ
jgi:hypothetical protein